MIAFFSSVLTRPFQYIINDQFIDSEVLNVSQMKSQMILTWTFGAAAVIYQVKLSDFITVLPVEQD